VCQTAELGRFSLPARYTSCGSIPGGPGGAGYAAVTGANGTTAMCEFCPIPNGQTLVEQLEATTSKWFAVLAVVVWIVITRIGAGYGFRYKRFVVR
jgi:hypothetical protein